MKLKLESRFPREISTNSDMQITPSFMAENEKRAKKDLDDSERGEWKWGLKLNNQKMKIMASGPITSWKTDGETEETVTEFILGGSKITADSDFSHEIKTHLLLIKKVMTKLSSVQFSCSVMSDSLWPHESQHTRPPCPSPTPGVHSDPRPSNQWCHPAISSSVIPFSSCPQSLQDTVFSNESTLRMRWPKYWSFSFSIIPSKEIPGLISFRMGWLDLLAAQRTLKSLLQTTVQKHQFFGAQLSSQANSHIHTWPLEKR